MGVPLVTAVLGQETAFIAVLVIVVFNLMAFTHGVIIMGGKDAFSMKALIKRPVIIAFVLGLALMLLRIKLPGPVATAASSFSGLNSPLAMLIIGAQLSRANIAGIFTQLKLYKVTALRNVIFPVIIAFALLLFGFDRITYIALVILLGTPSAGFTSILSERFGRNTALAAQLVSLSTIISGITLPLVTLLAETLAG